MSGAPREDVTPFPIPSRQCILWGKRNEVPNMRIPLLLALLSAVMVIPTGIARADTPCMPSWTDPAEWRACDQLQDTITGEIHAGGSVSYTFDLQPGDYSFAAWAGLDILSLSLTVKDPVSGAAIALDEGADNSPICEFTLAAPKTVDVTLAAGEARVSGVAGTYWLASASGTRCFARQACPVRAILDDWTSITAEENWSVVNWAALEVTGTDPIDLPFSLPAGEYTIVGETLHPRDDLDILVKQGSDLILTGNEEPDNNPICYFELANPSDIPIEIVPWQYGSGGAAVIGLLIVKKNQ
jgi:hypothetical protein